MVVVGNLQAAVCVAVLVEGSFEAVVLVAVVVFAQSETVLTNIPGSRRG